MNNWKSNTNKKPGLEYIPSVYNNPFMVDLYRAMKEKLKVCTNQSQSLDSIAKELGFITKANNYQIFFMGGLLVNAKKNCRMVNSDHGLKKMCHFLKGLHINI